MYDSIYMRLETNKPVYNKLDRVNEKTVKETGLISYQGYAGNIRVKQDILGIAFAGSLPKLLYGNNISRFSRQDTMRAIEYLSDTLEIPVIKANVFSLEIADSFIMKYPVNNYLDCLGDMRYFKPMIIAGQTKNYFNKNKCIKFYDKIIEMKSKKQVIPEIFQGRNVLRYEVKIQKRLSAAFKMPEVKAENLYNEAFYINALNLWKYFYFQIEKRKRIVFNGEAAMLDTKSFINQLALIGIQSMGMPEVKKMIELSKGNISRLQYSRLKGRLKELENTKSFTEPLETIQELDKKVKQAVMYYR